MGKQGKRRRRNFRKKSEKMEMILHIIHGANKFDLKIDVENSEECESSDEGQQNNAWTLLRLKQEIEKRINVGAPYQRLMFEGRMLSGDNLPLKDLNLKSGDKLMVVIRAEPGPREPSKDTSEINWFLKLDVTAEENFCEELADIESRLDGLQNPESPEQSKDTKRLIALKKMADESFCKKLIEIGSKLDGVQNGSISSSESFRGIDQDFSYVVDGCKKALKELDAIVMEEDEQCVKREDLVKTYKGFISEHIELFNRYNDILEALCYGNLLNGIVRFFRFS